MVSQAFAFVSPPLADFQGSCPRSTFFLLQDPDIDLGQAQCAPPVLRPEHLWWRPDLSRHLADLQGSCPRSTFLNNTLLLDGRWLLSLREINAGEEILLTKGWSFYQQASPVAASATEQ